MTRWFRSIALALCIASAGLPLQARGGGSNPSEPAPIVLVNRTADHKYDRALRASIRSFQERTRIQLGIVLQPHLPPMTTIETYAADVFKRTGLGTSSRGKGILLLWSEQERLFKIEVGYELEPVFPDAICHRLEEGARTFMLSHSAFARRDFLTELVVTLGIHYLDYEKDGQLSELMLPEPDGAYRLSGYLSGGGGVVGRGYAATVAQIQREIVPLSPQMRDAMQPDASAEVVVQRYLSSLEQAIGAPDLPLLTEGSRYFRMEKPHAPGYLRRIRAYYAKAMPLRILQKSDVAAAVFQPEHPVLPILLRKNRDGRWLVDEAGAWAYFHLFEDGSNPVPKYQSTPFSFVWHESAYRNRVTPLFADRSKAPPLRALPYDLKGALQSAEDEIARHPGNADAFLQAAELLHFEMYWLEAAAPLYEKFLELQPGRNDIRWRLIDIYVNTTDIDGQERQYLELLKRSPDDALLKQLYYQWFLRMYSASFDATGAERGAIPHEVV